jgi:dipeptidyl-peptidase-3
LATFYRTGATADRRRYDIAWVRDKDAPVDTINGFIEVYLDPRGVKGSWEAVVYYVNEEKTGAIRQLAREAQWFEDRMPWDRGIASPTCGDHRQRRRGLVEAGDSGPITPIGINLPNDQDVRERHGSKSVSLSNIIEAYDKSSPPALRTEFAWDDAEAARAEKWSTASANCW